MTSPNSSQGNNNVNDLEAGNYVAEDNFSKYLTLYRASVEGNWEEAQKFFKQHNNNNGEARLNRDQDTALHIAAKKPGIASFAENLVKKLTEGTHEALGIQNRYGLTPLHLAASFGNKKVAEILVEKDSSLLYRSCNRGLFPIHYAACHTGSKDVFLYFLGVTKNDVQHANPYAGPTGATLLVNLIRSRFYEEARKLVDEYPNVALHRTLDNETTPLEALVKYDCPIISKSRLSSLLKIFNAKKLSMHEQATNLLKCSCNKLKELNDTQRVASLASEAIIQAVYLDIDDVVHNIVEAHPMMVYQKDKSGQNILHIAVENRCKNVFNLLCGNSVLMHDLVEARDQNENNIVHLAGKLAPSHKLNLVSGAAFQMQRELQWFKEVEKVAPPYFSSLKNKNDKTPKMMFRDEHKDLKRAGEKWMKETSTACLIVAALIVTITFAATITVPGGTYGEIPGFEGFNATFTIPVLPVGSSSNVSNIFPRGYNGTFTAPDGNHTNMSKEGTPIFDQRTAFYSFYYFNGTSLIFAAISLFLFMSILTMPHAEHDFLLAFPSRLVLGLYTLLISVYSMMVAFGSIIDLVFGIGVHGREVNGLVLVVVTVLSFAIYVISQYRLFRALLSPGLRRKIFHKTGIPQMPF